MRRSLAVVTLMLTPLPASATPTPTDHLLGRSVLPREYTGERRDVHPARAVGVGGPPHLQLWKCVHRNERSAWTDGGGPYYGGLQMGWWFMRTYAGDLLRRKGTADRWTPLEQMWVAERAFSREGFSVRWFNQQWPPSAGRCGLCKRCVEKRWRP